MFWFLRGRVARVGMEQNGTEWGAFNSGKCVLCELKLLICRWLKSGARGLGGARCSKRAHPMYFEGMSRE